MSRQRMDFERKSTWAEVVGKEPIRKDATKGFKDFPFLAESSRRRLAVVRRCPAPLTMLAAALAFGLGSRPMSTWADGLTNKSNTASTPTVTVDYTLTSSTKLLA